MKTDTLHSSSATRRTSGGFTLIEMIGVLGIITIGLALVTPPAVQRIAQAFRDAEQQKLDALGDALRSRIQRSASIPAATNLVAELAAELGWPANEILSSRFGNRLFLFDDGFRVGPGGGSRPSFIQGPEGSVAPTNARILLVSSVGPALPNGLSSGFVDSATFASLWNTAPGSVPSGWTWSGDPADLRMRRVNLGDLFVQLIVNNQSSPIGRYSFNGAFTNPIPSASFSTFVMKGTRVGFHDANGTLQAMEVIDEPLSRTFYLNSWRADSPGAAPGWIAHRQLSGCDLQAVVDFFEPSPANPDSDSTPTEFADALAGLMGSYIAYAESGFNSSLRDAYKDATEAVKATANDLLK